MKIGFNHKRIQDTIGNLFSSLMTFVSNSINTLNNRVTKLENSDWVELISGSGNI